MTNTTIIILLLLLILAAFILGRENFIGVLLLGFMGICVLGWLISSYHSIDMFSNNYMKPKLLEANSEVNDSIDKLQGKDDLSKKAHQAIDDGYTVYVDCKKVDREAVNFNFKTYNIEINDKTKTVYLEKKVTGDND